ncbi:sugar phosphate isomerase/epimerase [Microbacterium sp.]|uniref:sugar phosphate isomerase/epimerase family protein n=1 Tax=Microbacterium sp. TaxID=51671 RepID=UPI002615ADCC|nr:sugar phosphate isomerase/epimerase [Microbacterium sp.]
MTREFGYCIFAFEGGDWSKDDFEGLDRGFALAAELGYDYVEVPSYVKPGLLGGEPRTDLEFFNRLGTVVELSRKHGVALSSIFAAADLFDEESREIEWHALEGLARIASTLGIEHLPVTVGMQRSSDELRWSRQLGALLTEAGRRTLEHGVRLAVHPHILCPLETRDEIDAFYEAADPAAVGMCLDTGHVLAGGSDPVELARDYAELITYVHAKDVDKEAADRAAAANDEKARYLTFRDAGDGDVDFAGVFEMLETAGFNGPILAENDLALDPEAAMRRSYAQLSAMLS